MNLSWNNVGMVIVAVFAALAALQYVTWMFSKARRERMGSQVRWLPDLIANIVDDFRHVLAAGLVVIFAVALAVSIFKADSVETGIGSVIGPLGPLMGAIIGYYFGESRRSRRTVEPPQSSSVDQRDSDDIQPAKTIKED